MRFKSYSIEDLPKNGFNTSENREKVKILIIDDEDFSYLDILKQHNFRITHINDLTDIEQTDPYGIILCDIKGVGRHFASKFEGAHVIQEIKKRYPLKVIYGYTGHQFDADYNQFFSMCDDMLKKDIDSDDWVEKLDIAISTCLDPNEQWKKIRNKLISINIPTRTIATIEDDFVRFALGKQNEFPSKYTSSKIPPEIKDILLSIIGNAIFFAIVA